MVGEDQPRILYFVSHYLSPILYGKLNTIYCNVKSLQVGWLLSLTQINKTQPIKHKQTWIKHPCVLFATRLKQGGAKLIIKTR